MKAFRLALLATLESSVLSTASLRDPVYALFFGGLFSAALFFQWLLHEEESLRLADPARLGDEDSRERVFFAGNELETDVEASIENSTLRDALGAGQQLKIRLGMMALFGIFLYWVFRGHVAVQMAMAFPILAALSIVPAMSLNHFMLPLAAATFGALAGSLGEHSTESLSFRALFVLGLAASLWAYRRVELEFRETERGALPALLPRQWLAPAGAAGAFLVICFGLNAIVPRFEPRKLSKPPAAPSESERKIVELLAKHLVKPPTPGTGSFADALAKQAAQGAGAGSALSGLSPSDLAAARALAQAMSKIGGGAGEPPPLPQEGRGEAPEPGGAGQGFPRTREEAQALLKQFADLDMGHGASPNTNSGAPPAAPARPPTAQAPIPQLASPQLPSNDAELARTLAAARELLGKPGAQGANSNPAGAGAANGAPAPGAQTASAAPGAPGTPASAASAPDPAEDSAALPRPDRDPTTRLANRLWWVLRLSLLLSALLIVGAFVRKLLLRPRTADDGAERRSRVSRRERRAIQTALSRLEQAPLSARDEVLARYALFLRAAALRDRPKEDWLPPTDFGVRIGEAFPPVAESSHVVTDIYCETAYADQPPEGPKLETFRAACGRAIHGMLN